MTCFNPKYAQLIWKPNKDKTKMVKGLNFETRDNFYKLKEAYKDGFRSGPENPELLIVPCRKCIGCKLDHAMRLATRCYLESRQWKHNCFITLTYNNENLGPKSLVKKDIQDFLKRLRDKVKGYESREYKGKIEYPIRYFYSGEYGPRGTHRKHFHIGLFNFMPPDAIFKKYSKKGMPIYESQLIAKKWGKGFHSVQEMNYETATYIARYTIKKLLGTKLDYKNEGLVPEFIEMSRRGGIGYQYLEDKENFDKMLRNYGIFVNTKKGVRLNKIPMYYRNKWKNYDEENMTIRKDDKTYYPNYTYIKRIEADINTEKMFEQTDIKPWEYLEIQKRTLLEKLKNSKSLKREDFEENDELPGI